MNAIALLAALAATAGQHADVNLQTLNASPLARPFTPPALASATADDWQFGVTASAASISIAERAGPEVLILDGETHSTEFVLWLPRKRGWRLGVNLPLIAHSGGFLDATIDRFHDLTGLPGGERGAMGRDELVFAYRRGTVVPIRLEDSTDGVGDLTLRAQRCWHNSERCVQLGWRLPTGDDARLLGGGAQQLHASVDLGGTMRANSWRWRAAMGASWFANDGLFAGQRKRFAPYLQGHLSRQLNARWSLRAMLQGQGKLYESDIDALAGPTLLLGLGIAWQPRPGHTLVLEFDEDLSIDRAADVVVRLGWQLGLQRQPAPAPASSPSR